MCGFVGFIGEPGALDAETLERLAARMADRLESRGPDDAGTWVSPSAGIALGHRRLAIIDLTAAGHQPMVSASGRSVIAYNGEVYNFADIRRELEAENRQFRGGSDTEVVLEACEAWGVERAVSKFIGMFAFAFWDANARRLTLVRDRLGIKPLYWGRSGGVLFFGSQPKAFADHPAWRPVVDRDALAAYLRHAYVPAPRSIFQGIEKPEPGSMVEIDAEGRESRHRYWVSLLFTPSGAETLVFWVSQPLAWLVAPKDVLLMTRRGDLKLSHDATAKARENAVKQDRVQTTNAIKSP